MSGIPYLDAAAIRSRLRPRAAVDALSSALDSGLDPSRSEPRSIVSLNGGELLLMPAEFEAVAGVKVATVAPGNDELGLPRIQGVFVLFDAKTLTPIALLDGMELTALRTPAVSLLAVRDRLLASSSALHMLVIGTGIQGTRHVDTAVDVVQGARPVATVTYLSRRPDAANVPRPDGVDVHILPIGSPDADQAIARAGLVVCATSAGEPLFDGALVNDDAAVVAVGSHDPGRRELDGQLMSRATVIVEDVTTALREAGDVVHAVEAGLVGVESLIPLATVIAKASVIQGGRPLVFKSSGMAWQDVVVANAVMNAD